MASRKGFIFKNPEKIKAPPAELLVIELPQDARTKMGPSGLTSSEVDELHESTKPRVMFAAAAAAKPVAAKHVVAEKPAPVVAEKPAAPVIKQPTIKQPVKLAEPPLETKQKLELLAKLPSMKLKKLGRGFLEEELDNPYSNPPPRAYVPETHRNFAEFIKMNYADFILPPVGQGPPMEPGDKYPYQKFVREYMRQASPYRGILVYHGLGSGKTCSAIAASEALFSTAGKKIIVMTPFSLRKNFLREVSFCGFKHFRLENHWVALDKSNPTERMFGLEVLGLSEGYIRTATKIWVPDFNPALKPNFTGLSSDEQAEIRKQILSQLVWDEEKNPKGRIRFINYNGISAKKLKAIACQKPDFFDDAVIIIDEIHNVVRLIHGEIEPYLKTLPGKKGRKIEKEIVTVEPWKPSLCDKETNYRRGYLFYRLLLSARRSKIIGLSGTPLINFPEELGILANILHGYIPLFKGVINQTGEKARNAIKNIALKHPNLDFVSVEPSTEGIELTATLLEEGLQKVKGSGGVERIHDSSIPSHDEIKTSLIDALKAGNFTFRTEPSLIATPLLHPFGEEFQRDFLSADGLELKNKFVLGKRLLGLVSYYKGSRQDLMPKIKVDEVVRIPFSSYSQGAYSKIRIEEIKIEEKKKDAGPGGLGAVWGEVYDIGQKASSSNYRMGSRQMCNFAFPDTITRPRTKNKAEEEMEPVVSDLVINDVDIDETQDKLGFLENELEALPAEETGGVEDVVLEEEEEEAKEEEAKEEEAKEEEAKEENVLQKGGISLKQIAEIKRARATALAAKAEAPLEAAIEAPLEAPLEAPAEPVLEAPAEPVLEAPAEPVLEAPAEPPVEAPVEAAAEPVVKPTTISFKEAMAKRKAAKLEEQMKQLGAIKESAPKATAPKAPVQIQIQTQIKCKGPIQEGETYKQAILRSKDCLRRLARTNLLLNPKEEESLAKYSPKYAAILQRIIDAPGSSLVYSQFLDMEGIGIFRIVMDINGFAPIEIVRNNETGELEFSKATKLSLKNPKQSRYITFSGEEKDDVRRMALNVFNAKFDELSGSIKSVLDEAGYTNNHTGQLCRVFCITSAGAEGLSLKNVRAVHIMEPYWNDVRLKQVKGRAIRIGSHLELPEADRNVSIYTYISVFGDEAQRADQGEMRIDETIVRRDGIDRATAIKLGLIDVKKEADEKMKKLQTYVLTSDMRLYIISERKKKVIEELENVMKGAAVDCELSSAENQDGTFQCLSLKDITGDFAYEPELSKDIAHSANKFVEVKRFVAPAPVVIAGKKYWAAANRDAKGARIGFSLYNLSDRTFITKVGTAEVDPANPDVPVNPKLLR